MSDRLTDVEISQEELAQIRERADKYEEQDKPLYRTRFRKEDIDFVDNAREDIPKLLAEIERLKASKEYCKRLVGELIHENAILKGEKPITVHLNGGDDE